MASSSAGSTEHLLDESISAAQIGIASPEPPDRVRAIVVGGGIVGVSVALHLARLGWSDTLLIERDRLSCGTTWHPAGLLAGVRATHALTEISNYSLESYRGLEEESGISTGFNGRGCLTLARTEDRMTELLYMVDVAHHHGLDASVVDVAEIRRLNPLVDTGGLVGGVITPGDATVNPGASTLAYAKLAAEAGVTIVEGCALDSLVLRDDAVAGVSTGRRTIECEVVVLCTGLWTWNIASDLSVPAALHAAEHMWVMSEPTGEPVDELPYVRDLDGHFYVRGYRDRLLVGAFEPNGKPRSPKSIPENFSFAEFEPDREHFSLPLGKARERVGLLREIGIERWLNGPETFTPDGNPLLGESAEIDGLFLAAGLNSQGILLGPGVGRAVAEWIVAGSPQFDSAAFDVRRFAPEQASIGFLGERTRETLGRLYAMHWPRLEYETTCGTQGTPLHERTATEGACFGELFGWVRPNWYGEAGTTPIQNYSFGRPGWFHHVALEHRAAREHVAVFDLSSFGKTLVGGVGALALMQKVCSADLDTEVGRITYTAMLNSGGGVEVDLTVTRLAEAEFLVVAPTITQRAVLGWLRRYCNDGRVGWSDVTHAYAVLAVMGPESRELLAPITSQPLGSDRFPYQHGARIEVGGIEVIALRTSFVGELGWELYVPSEQAVELHDRLREAGGDRPPALAGYYALDSLRLEKGFRHWGVDMGPADTPIEAGIGFTVDWQKGEFVGRSALEGSRGKPPKRRLVSFLLADPEPLIHHGEAIFRDGQPVGHVTSGAYAHTLGSSAMLGMVHCPSGVNHEYLEAATFEIEVTGERFAAAASLQPLLDPAGERVRA